MGLFVFNVVLWIQIIGLEFFVLLSFKRGALDLSSHYEFRDERELVRTSLHSFYEGLCLSFVLRLKTVPTLDNM